MKRTGKSQKTGKQYTYYCCEFGTSRDEEKKCDFMTWDVPTKDDCPVCGQTMFKKAGKGFKKPFCINPACENFLPEDKRGFVRKKAAGRGSGGGKAGKEVRREEDDRENRRQGGDRREEDCREKDGRRSPPPSPRKRPRKKDRRKKTAKKEEN